MTPVSMDGVGVNWSSVLPGSGTGKSQQTALRCILDLQNHPTNQVELKRTTICVGENTTMDLSVYSVHLVAVHSPPHGAIVNKLHSHSIFTYK